MTRSRSVVLAAFGASLMALPLAAGAQTAARPPAAHPAGGTGAAGLTLQQFQARHDREMLAADTDGDGRVSRTEFLAANEGGKAKAGKGDPAKRFAKLDRNGDGSLDKAEIDASLAKRFQRRDANGDGVLTAQERAAAKQKGGKADPEG